MTAAKIKTAVDYAQFWLEKGREIYEGTDLEKQTTLHAGNVLKLAEELAALKEKIPLAERRKRRLAANRRGRRVYSFQRSCCAVRGANDG